MPSGARILYLNGQNIQNTSRCKYIYLSLHMYTVGLDVTAANRDLAMSGLFPSLVIEPRNIKKSGRTQYHPTRRYLQSTVVPSHPSRLDPFFVTGFTDAEGSFILSINKSTRYKVGWSVACLLPNCLTYKRCRYFI